ncbi:HNH endonuclease [Campylobacter jejuni]|uniref:HNH endonuclease n=1 Tax=Campylobacter jejuni TaxID=197 RepID=UPI000B3FBDA6|nr:HNH endonuclease signature motif containing protein [Campylobacter jejuni]EAH6837638.1 HNH endonuclease [Campylobacter jejuni]EAH9820660.1 HNH endonuclease [Campylobacter jejuni]EAI3325021.1 HNH endonuclease [Campylobacter jejuni]EAI4945934.1 HNH endonuclease [Campylobacter jejuni]EAI5281057.1 HNH endonuclease [Campylobacter jejuni]
MREIKNIRYKRKHTDLFFDSFKHFKHNLSNLIGVELPTLCKLGVEKYLKLIDTNYKSKYPDMRKIGLIEYDRPQDANFTLTPEAELLLTNPYLEQNTYDESNLKPGRKNINSLSPQKLINSFYIDLNMDISILQNIRKFYPENLLQSLNYSMHSIYQHEILRLILSYYDTADSIRPYLALLKFIKHHNITQLSKDLLRNILAQTKEDILLMKYNTNAFCNLSTQLQEEIQRPISYIHNFLQTALVIDSNFSIIVDFNFIDRIQIEMNNIVFQLTPSQNNSRPAREQRMFRESVLKAYNNKCAITGQGILIDNRVLLEAAHIIPYRDGGSFATSNGIALSYEMHKMLDNGLFGFFYDKDNQLRIKVSRSKSVTGNYDILNSLDNQVVSIPSDSLKKPNPFAIAYNMDKYLLK